MLLLPQAQAQQDLTILNEYKVQPEVWHVAGPEEPGVDAKGDLSLSVPVLTVPGRGLQYDIAFTYRAGVTVDQDASWIGLGWNFDPGSLTREVEGGALRFNSKGFPAPRAYGVDVFDEDFVDATYTAAQPDAYYLYLPGRGTFGVTQVNNPAFTTTTVPPFSPGRFMITEHQPWTVECQKTTTAAQAAVTVDGRRVGYRTMTVASEAFTPRDDYVRCAVTTDDGTRYVFARPTLGYTDSFGAGDGGMMVHRQVHVTTWRLVAILGADFTAPIPDDLDPEWPQSPWPTDEDTGSWIRFEYGDPKTEITRTEQDGDDVFVQTRYLRAVTTPTHRAEFTLARRYSPYVGLVLDEDSTYLRLTAVTLRSRISGEVVERVELVQDHLLGPRGVSGDETDHSHGRLRLKRLRFTGRNGTERPGYAFSYYDHYTGLPGTVDPETGDVVHVDGLHERSYYPPGCVDYFGYLLALGTCEGAGGTGSWSLRQIRYPTGGYDEISYEDDAIDEGLQIPFFSCFTGDMEQPDYYECTENFFAYGLTNSRGGARVHTIKRYDGMLRPDQTPSYRTTEYTYGRSFVSGVPVGYWRHLSLADASTAPLSVFAPSNRGQVGVYYATITKAQTGRDGTREGHTTTHYSVPYHDGAPSSYLAVRPIDIYYMKHRGVFGFYVGVVQGDQGWNWGRTMKVETWDRPGGAPLRVVTTPSQLSVGPTSRVPNTPVAWIWPARELRVAYHPTRLSTEMEETRSRDEAQLQVTRMVEYGYDDATNLVRQVRERYTAPGASTFRWRVTEKTFAYERYGAFGDLDDYSAFTAGTVAHLPGPVVAEDVWDGTVPGSSASGGYLTSSVTTWGATMNGFYRPRATYRWRSAGTSATRPSGAFTQWGEQLAACTPATANPWQRDVYYDAYDANGRPSVLWNARCTTTRLTYDPSLEGAYLTHAAAGPFELHVTYDATSLQATHVVDETGKEARFDYDDLGRLTGVRNTAGDLVAAHAYHFGVGSDGRFDAAAPNRVSSTLYRGDADASTAKQFFDGLGRHLQTHTPHGTGVAVAASDYDAQGRPWRTWKPYPSATNGYDPNYAGAVIDHYDGFADRPDGNGRPYVETVYFPDPLQHVRRRHAEGEGGVGVASRYGVEALDGAYYAFTETTDENGGRARVYRDALGREVRRRSYAYQPGAVMSWYAEAHAAYGGKPGDEAPPVATETITVPGGGVVAWSCTFNIIQGGAASLTISYTQPDGDIVRVAERVYTPGRTCRGSFFAEHNVVYTLRLEASAPLSGSDARVSATAVHRAYTYGRAVETGFVYDAMGNLVEAAPPNAFNPPDGSLAAGWKTTYSYNSLGQLLEKDTPDDDAVHRYAYDAAGNLRRYRDPNRAGGGFIYSDYDAYGRLVETGVCTSGTVDPAAVVPLGPACTGARAERDEVVAYTYDTPTPDRLAQADLDDDGDGYADHTIEHPEGRPTQVVFPDGFTLYSYDVEGRPAWQYVALDGLPGKRVAYTYDRQGNVTAVHYQPGRDDAFTLAYTYDEAGRLETVSSRVANGPTVQEAQYGYTAAGQVESLRLGPDETLIPPVDYRYHLRGWLGGINDVVAPAAEPFALRLSYEPNGNVAAMAWATHGNEGGTAVGYTYSYDAFNRLIAADFSTGGPTGETTGSSGDYLTPATEGGIEQPPAGTYDVAPITYDDNGNITSLTRHTLDAAANPQVFTLAYHYAGSNRVDSVSGSLAMGFEYDAGGNMTRGRSVHDVRYDHRNLPYRMTGPNGSTLAYRYDAAGKRVATGQDDDVDTHYVRGPGGEVLAVYTRGTLTYWNILAGGTVIGRVAVE